MRLVAILGLMFVGSCGSLEAAQPLPRATPESQGISSAALLDFVEHADAEVHDLHSIMLLRHGHVVAEGWWAPFQAEDRHMLYSLSKSFTSMGVGIAIAEGKLGLHDTVLSHLGEYGPENPSDNLKMMRVKDLLRMATGHLAPEVAGFTYTGGSAIRKFLALPVALKPGTHFMYNSPGTYMCSAILQKATGQKLHDYLGPRLLAPLGIEGSWWDESDDGVTLGGSGFHIRTEDIAKFGQLLLQRGQWQGKQLVPASWVDEATSLQTSNGSDPNSDWEVGYGYQFWRCTPGFYRADGAFGQFCFVMPQHDAVLVMTSGVADTGAQMRCVWKHLLPALQSESRSEDAKNLAALREKLGSLALATVPTAELPTLAKQVSGRRYGFLMDEAGLRALTLEFDGDQAMLTVENRVGTYRIAVGQGEWLRGKLPSIVGLTPPTYGLTDRPARDFGVAACGGWTDPTTYTIKISLHETPYMLTLPLQFADDTVELIRQQNVAFGPILETGPLIGKRSDK